MGEITTLVKYLNSRQTASPRAGGISSGLDEATALDLPLAALTSH